MQMARHSCSSYLPVLSAAGTGLSDGCSNEMVLFSFYTSEMDMRQKSKIIVNEQGTEAAAVSELLGAPRAVLKTKKLYFNEPFFYMIMDMNTEVPLFIGILDNPMS